METTDTVVGCKERHSDKVGVPCQHIKLKLNGAELTDDCSLDDVKVSAANNTIPLVARERVTINVMKPDGEMVPHEMESTDTVVVVKKKHADKVKLDPKNVKFLYQDSELPDD